MAQNWRQAYGLKVYLQIIKKDLVDLANLSLGGLGSGKFMNNTTLLANTASIIKIGTGTSLGIGAGTVKATTTAALTSNVVTLTFAAAHGFTAAQKIVVSGFTGDFAPINGAHTVVAVTTSSPFTLTYALTATNITSASAVGSVLPALKLDGTDTPFRLLGLSNVAPDESESAETVDTYDDELQGYEADVATKKALSWTLEGAIDYADAAYKLARIASKDSVREGLMVKYAVTAPAGVSEVEFGYGRMTGFQKAQPAAGVITWSGGIKAYGPYELDWT